MVVKPVSFTNELTSTFESSVIPYGSKTTGFTEVINKGVWE